MTDTEKQELEILKKRADKMGITYSPNIGLSTLRERVNGALESNNKPMDNNKDTPIEQKNKVDKHKEALKLVRVEISSNNKNKSALKGEIIEAGNSIVKGYKKFVPFNTPTYIPKIIFNVMKDKKCLTYYKEKVNGVELTRHKEIYEYNITELPPLTKGELEAIKQRQLADPEFQSGNKR